MFICYVIDRGGMVQYVSFQDDHYLASICALLRLSECLWLVPGTLEP
jgi:hypothetical protein